MDYIPPYADDLVRRLAEPRRFIQVITGPRQVGKTTLVQQVIERTGMSARFAGADEPTLRGGDWIEQQWDASRGITTTARHGSVLVLGEVQKAPH
ncbi:MAG: AAA family ATPase [Phycisphaerae bacterium]